MINILDKTRVYLSGPMDFVGSRVVEKFLGWRSILTPILDSFSIRVLDPWNKPKIRGHANYGEEGILPPKEKYTGDFWESGSTRAQFAKDFWETVHIDLRMTDVADYVIAFAPTNIYSVGTVHEIIIARQQHKPVLLVSPPIKYSFFPEIENLPSSVKDTLKFYGLRENAIGLPSQWYGNVIGGQNLFDGFGWENLEIKRSDFYPALLDEVMQNTKPGEDADEDEKELWERVKKWVDNFEPLQNLKGSPLDYIKYDSASEKKLFEEALETKHEKERIYFWYNQPYKSKRPLLYHFFSLASGYIPPKIKVLTKIDDEGQIHPETYETADDNWLLISPDA